ncbi:deoxyribodipyrimidine photolyase [freshwater metagenome]|uniref:Deoxyribodipyrimidine photolyase n=1 Tax=freshwater metagenome TaxID=449393 RepID=A0A094PVU0_9ZZZZ
MKRILYIAFDHLHRNFGVLKDADPQNDLLVLVESARMTSGRPWHPLRLHFLISSAHHFAQDLRSEGFTVEYITSATTTDGLDQVCTKHGDLPIVAAEPSSFKQSANLSAYGVNFIDNDFFLTPRSLFSHWASSQKSFLMENFYRGQRIRLGVLVEGNSPVGGAWNFDKENRLPPPKNYEWPPYLEFAPDEIDKKVAQQLGIAAPNTWATTRTGALAALANFIENHFAEFGPYEDAMPSDNWALHHSLLSPYINNGLLHPSEVVEAAVKAFDSGKIPIASCEGFIRQVIGWREYVNGMYWFLGEDYRNNNQLGAQRPLFPLFTDPDKTSMNCVKSIVGDIKDRAWVHHIPRLMVLSNLALITGSNPQEFLDWMRENFVDASEWVMVPNVIGMGLHADGGAMMTKPYAAGGAYISRMSTYCKGCAYNPKLRVGETACPFTTLYWDFLDRHREDFAKNHRMSQQLFGINRLSDLPQLKERAVEVLEGLDRGEI